MNKLIFLGTGDAIPDKVRNHSAIYISISGENLLFDCGEGTQKQMRIAKINPCKITRIFLTHWHGDHVLGLPGLLSTLALSGYNKELKIYGPPEIKNNFFDMLKVFPFKRDYKISFEEVSSGQILETKEFYIESEKMQHSVPCVAYSLILKGHLRIKKEMLNILGSGPHIAKLKGGESIEFKGKQYSPKKCLYKEDDFKISIIFDTKLNKKIEPFVKNSNLFICEASYLEELKKEAEKHFHMTSKQVAKIAKNAKVEKLFLVHISSRYSKNKKKILEEAKEIFNITFLAKVFNVLDF